MSSLPSSVRDVVVVDGEVLREELHCTFALGRQLAGVASNQPQFWLAVWSATVLEVRSVPGSLHGSSPVSGVFRVGTRDLHGSVVCVCADKRRMRACSELEHEEVLSREASAAHSDAVACSY